MRSLSRFVAVHARSILVIIVVATIHANAATGDQASRNQALKDALTTVADFAERLCKDIPLRGTGQAMELSGRARADLKGVAKYLAGLGIEGAAKYSQSEYEGVPQKDIAAALRDTARCKVDVLRELRGVFGLPEGATTFPGAGTQEAGSTPDFPGGSRTVYSANFAEWPSARSEHGSAQVQFGAYVIQPISNTWVGPGRTISIPALESDFVIDVRFRIEARNPSASLNLGLSGAGPDAPSVAFFLSVLSDENVTYSLYRQRIKTNFYVLNEGAIAERAPLPGAAHNWNQGSKITFKREGGAMHIFVNDKQIADFAVSVFPVASLSVAAAFPSKITITSIEARVPA